MTTLQQQIYQLALQLEQLASQVENPVEHKDIDFEKLVLEARQLQFQFHPVAKYDEYVKTLYLEMLLSMATYTEYVQEERYRFIARIFNGFEMQEDFIAYVHKSHIVTVEQFSRFSLILNESKLTKSFLIDALMMLGIQQEKKASQYIAEMASALHIDETDFKAICQLVVAILQVDHEGIARIIDKFPDFRFAAVHYLQAVQSPYSPVLFVIGTGTERIKVKNFENKTSIHLENVCIVLDKGIELESLEKFYLKNCQIESKMLSLKLKMVDDIYLDNVTFENIEKIKQITIQHCPKVRFNRIQMKNCSVHNQSLFNIKNVSYLTIINNHFEYIKLYVKETDEKESLIKLKNIQQLQDSSNTKKQCEVFKVHTALWSKASIRYIKSHAIKKIISKK